LMFSGVSDDGRRADDLLRRPDLGPRASLGADGLNGQAVAQHVVVADLVELTRREFEGGGGTPLSVSQLHEGRQLVERDEVPHPVGQLLGHVAGVVSECLGRVARLLAAT
jgi:hypothetical protein